MRKPGYAHHSAENRSQTGLLIREWMFITGFFGLLLCTVCISHFSKVSSQITLKTCALEATKSITITLTGATENPGEYQVEPGSTLGDLVKQIKLLDSAHRKQIPYKKVFYSPQVIEIPAK